MTNSLIIYKYYQILSYYILNIIRDSRSPSWISGPMYRMNPPIINPLSVFFFNIVDILTCLHLRCYKWLLINSMINLQNKQLNIYKKSLKIPKR